MKAALKKVLKPAWVSVASQCGPHRRKAAEPRLWVLMYHRILPRTDERFRQEEPGMVVTPESLDMHIQELKRHFEILSLEDWIQARNSGAELPKRACALTFDDGWLDNYQYAFPLLKKHNVPATLFAVADKIGTDFQFWPNIVAALLINGEGRKLLEHPVLNPAGMEEIDPGNETISLAIKRLKIRSDADIFEALEEIEWRRLYHPSEPALMNWAQLNEMLSSGLVQVGSHTCSHARLGGNLTEETLKCEIVHSRNLLEKQTERAVNLFCFPNGDYNQQALDLVQAHYRAAVTTQRGINRESALRLHELTRIGVHDDISCTRTLFNARLSGWV